jgi:hypothetical protein
MPSSQAKKGARQGTVGQGRKAVAKRGVVKTAREKYSEHKQADGRDRRGRTSVGGHKPNKIDSRVIVSAAAAGAASDLTRRGSARGRMRGSLTARQLRTSISAASAAPVRRPSTGAKRPTGNLSAPSSAPSSPKASGSASKIRRRPGAASARLTATTAASRAMAQSGGDMARRAAKVKKASNLSQGIPSRKDFDMLLKQ